MKSCQSGIKTVILHVQELTGTNFNKRRLKNIHLTWQLGCVRVRMRSCEISSENMS